MLVHTAVSLCVYSISNEKIHDLLNSDGLATLEGKGGGVGVRVMDDVHGNAEVKGLCACVVDTAAKALGVYIV